MGDIQQIQFFEDMLTKARREGNQFQQAEALGSLGNLYVAQGSPQKAIESLKEALRIYSDVLHDNDKAAATCKSLASCYELGLGDSTTARRLSEMAANLANPNNPQKKTLETTARRLREGLSRRR